MAEEKIENGQKLEEEAPPSLFEKKMKGLLDELDERLEEVGGDYGPILMEDLQNRLEHVVNNFNNEVRTMVTESFNKWKVTDSQLREFVNSNIKVPDKKTVKEKKKKASTPKFIKDVEFGPLRSK
jgi:hypothetical protein